MNYKEIIKKEIKKEKETYKEFNNYKDMEIFLRKDKNKDKKKINEENYEYFLDNENKLFDSILELKINLLQDKNLSIITNIYIKNTQLEKIEFEDDEIDYDDEIL